MYKCSLNQLYAYILIIRRINGVIKKMKKILLTEKKMVFLVLLYFHDQTKISSTLLDNNIIYNKKTFIKYIIIKRLYNKT